MSSIQRLGGRPTLLRPSLGVHSVERIVQRLSVIRATWPAHLHFILQIDSTESITLVFCLMWLWFICCSREIFNIRVLVRYNSIFEKKSSQYTLSSMRKIKPEHCAFAPESNTQNLLLIYRYGFIEGVIISPRTYAGKISIWIFGFAPYGAFISILLAIQFDKSWNGSLHGWQPINHVLQTIRPGALHSKEPNVTNRDVIVGACGVCVSHPRIS